MKRDDLESISFLGKGLGKPNVKYKQHYMLNDRKLSYTDL